MTNPFDQNLFTPAIVRAIQERCLDDAYRLHAAPVPAGQLLKPWQDVDTSGDETVYPEVPR